MEAKEGTTFYKRKFFHIWLIMRSKIIIVFIIIIFVLSIALVISQKKNHFISKLYDSIILDNKNHYLTCDELPDIQTVEKVFAKHKKEADEITKIGANISVAVSEFDNPNCKGKADIYIEYGSHDQRIKIEKIIGNTFFGIPYRMRNT